MIPTSVGVLAMLLGVSLMLWHWWRWTEIQKSSPSPLELRYGQNQFRRRAVVGSMMALTGAILVSLSWVHDYRVFTASIVLLLLLLVCILILAVLDLLHVIVYLRLGPPSHAARSHLIDEYRRRQKNGRSKDQDSTPE